MKLIFKICSIATLIIVSIVMFFVGKFPLAEGYNPFYPDVDTFFSDNYSEKMFRQIKVGDDTCLVIKMIGYPIYAKQETIGSQWIYSSDGKCKWNDFAWLFRSLLIDEKGKVSEINAQIVFD